MKRFCATCHVCAWESEEADAPEVAAEIGVAHLATAHPAVLQQGDVSLIRVWSFDKLRVIVGTADITLEAEPEQQEPAPPEPVEHQHKQETKKPAEGRKGR